VIYGISSLTGDLQWKKLLPVDAQIVSFTKHAKKHPQTFYEQVQVVFDYSGGGYQQTQIIEGKNGGTNTVDKGLKKQQNKVITLADDTEIELNLEHN